MRKAKLSFDKNTMFSLTQEQVESNREEIEEFIKAEFIKRLEDEYMKMPPLHDPKEGQVLGIWKGSTQWNP